MAVSEQYAEGAVSIVDLLDAQRQALQEDQRSALSVYRYLQDLLAYQRAISWFEINQSAEQKRVFINRLQALVEGSSPARQASVSGPGR